MRIAIALRCVVIMLFLCRHFWSVCSFETVPRDLETSALRVYRVHFSPQIFSISPRNLAVFVQDCTIIMFS